MPINAFPINTVAPTANLIAFAPSGPISATDVQSAINQLVSLMPAPGPGTDPLFLTKALKVTAQNSISIGSSTQIEAADISMATDSSVVDPVFSNIVGLNIRIQAAHGQATNNAKTQAKISFMPLNVSGYYNASGQKFLYNNFGAIGFGMGDTSIWANNYVQFGGGPVNGDEGQGWGLVSNLTQQTFLVQTKINNKPAQSTVNTTTTQAIIRSKDTQTVTVVSAAGAAVGDWVVIEQQPPNGGPNLEAVQVEAVSATTITGKFRFNHDSGVTVTPALVIDCNATFQMGQDRVLINLSQPSYAVGTVTGKSGGALIGTGTGWSNGMVGGNANNIGAIALDADDFTGAPFDSGANRLKSWFQLISVTDATHIGVHSFSVAGDASYNGKGPGSGGYIIRPAARILRIIADAAANVTGRIVCETVSSAWAVNDNVECAICPYADVTGFQYSMSAYTNGGSYRQFMVIKNTGARMFDSVFSVADWGIIHQPTGDDISFSNILSVGTKHNVTINSNFAQQAVIQMHTPASFGGATDAGARFVWDSAANCMIGSHCGNGGLQILPFHGLDGSAPSGPIPGALQFVFNTVGMNTDANLKMLCWGGWIYLPLNFGIPGYIVIDNATGANFERSFMRWESGAFAVGTEKGGSGNQRDMILKADNVEIMRMLANGSNIKFGAANFVANGSVATVLGSLGPPGAATTVQKWLTFQDSGGVTRYVPCF